MEKLSKPRRELLEDIASRSVFRYRSLTVPGKRLIVGMKRDNLVEFGDTPESILTITEKGRHLLAAANTPSKSVVDEDARDEATGPKM